MASNFESSSRSIEKRLAAASSSREVSERFLAKFGPQNAPATFLYGLNHEDGHVEQFRDVRAQAAAALAANAIRTPSLPSPEAAGD